MAHPRPESERPSYMSLHCFLWLLCAVVASMGSFSGIIGCGIKGMPSPPHVEPVPAVSDLSHQIEGEQVVLSWTVPDRIREGDFGNGEMMISRARIKLEDGPCTDCPLVFQRIATGLNRSSAAARAVPLLPARADVSAEKCDRPAGSTTGLAEYLAGDISGSGQTGTLSSCRQDMTVVPGCRRPARRRGSPQ